MHTAMATMASVGMVRLDGVVAVDVGRKLSVWTVDVPIKTASVVSSLGELDGITDVEVANTPLVDASSTDVDVELAESAVNPGLCGGSACFEVEEEHMLH